VRKSDSLWFALLAIALAAQGCNRVARNVSYDPAGTDSLTALDIYPPRFGGHHPVVIFIHGGSYVEGDKSTERFIFRVTEIIDPTLDASSPEGKSISDTLQNSYGEDVVTEYIGRLENDFGVTVNQPAFNQVIGGGGQQ